MQRKSFDGMSCPIARSLEHVGEWWSILILRDAARGMTRFDEFQKSLGIAPNMLTRRLSGLVEAGFLERRQYSERPPRDEYVLTPRGQDFRPVLWAIMAFGNRHFAPEGESVVLVDAETGLRADPVLIDRVSGKAMTPATFRPAPGPAAAVAYLQRYGAASEAGHP
jgi:DNA-binding HxlR family transcriptional regulator